MTLFTRREFLRRITSISAALTGGWLLSACSDRDASLPAAVSTPTFTAPSSPTTKPLSPAESAGEASVPAVTPSAEFPHMVVARGDDPEELVRQALTALGGMQRYVSPGDNVLVKPNICVAYHTYEYAATTNPWLVGGLVKLCLAAGARRVTVLDYPFGGTPEEAYVRSGIQEQVIAAGGEMETMASFKFVKTDIPDGLDIQQWAIYDEVINADVVINVPIAKHHSLARLTLGMKNLMGTIKNRAALHRNLGQRLADLTSRIRPALTVVDAVRILMDHGPTGGSLNDVKQLNTVIISPDIVAADSYAATLFGLQPHDLSYVQAGTAMGLGRSNLGGLNIEEIAVGG